MAKRTVKRNNGYSANLGFEETLWAAADKLRGNMDASEYKSVVLGLIFLKFISDAFENRYQQLNLELSDPANSAYVKEPAARYETLEDRDEYTAENVFWVASEARWDKLQAAAKSPEIGILIDKAMVAIEKDNPRLKGVLPKNYARPDLDKTRLGGLLDLIGTIGLGDAESQKKDILGRVYEYFLGKFASAEGKAGGEFYTPACVVKLLVAMLEPFHGRIYDPCCGSGGMFVQSEDFVKAHGGKIDDIHVYGQESNAMTWKLAKMNLAIRQIDVDLGPESEDTFKRDLHPDLKADFILANPPFNLKDWGGENLKDDTRWKFGTPPTGNANYAWIQHIIHHLAPHGFAGFVMANGSMSSKTSGEGDIRKAIIEADLVDCMIALPGQLFYSTAIPACLWFLARDKSNNKKRDRRGEILFIDARKMGILRDRTHRELTNEDIEKISQTYHAWRQGTDYHDTEGFCTSVDKALVAQGGYFLTPGRFIRQETFVNTEGSSEKLVHLARELKDLMSASQKLDREIEESLQKLGYE